MGARQAKHDKETVWSERQRYMKMSPKTRRQHYFCDARYIPPDHIVTWQQYYTETLRDTAAEASPRRAYHSVNQEINNKVAVFEGDITFCEVDGIVTYLYQGSELLPGSVTRDIMTRAGDYYCDELLYKGVPDPGGVKVTGGYSLPARYVINTTIPTGLRVDVLKECYTNSLEAAVGHGMRTVAFPCLSPKRFKGVSREQATHVALNSIREYLNINKYKMDMVIFCVVTQDSLSLYERLMQVYFPVDEYEDRLTFVKHATCRDKQVRFVDARDQSGCHTESIEADCRPLSAWQLEVRGHGTQVIHVSRCYNNNNDDDDDNYNNINSGIALLKQIVTIYTDQSLDLRNRPLFKYADEPGIDMGALSREFFSRTLEAVVEAELGLTPAFEGQPGHRLPCASKVHSSQNVYQVIGTLLAHSVLHGGGGLVGLSPAFVFLLSHRVSRTEVETSGITLDICDLPDDETRELFEKSDRLNNLEDDEREKVCHQLLTAMERCSVGYCPITAEVIPAIQQEILLHEVVFKRWDQVEELRRGMDVLSLYSFLCENPTESNTRKVFPRSADVELTPEAIKSKLNANGVDPTLLEHFLTFVYELHAGSIENCSLRDLLAFWTGSPTLTSDPLHLSVGDENQLPVAHCCFLQLQLPRVSAYEKLKEKLIFALAEGSAGFHME